MAASPLVSVIIPAYNAGHFIAQAIESALAQTNVRTDVLVIDDGSTDNTADVVATFGKQVKYLRQANGGPARARNLGLREANGDFIAFLDADDYWLSDKLQRQLACLDAQPSAAVVHTAVVDLQQATGERTRRGAEEFCGDCYLRLFRGNRITLSSVVVRRNCLLDAGGFDERIRNASVEDYDLLLRIAREHPFAYLDEPLVVYRLHGANATHNAWRIYAGDLVVIERALKADPALRQRIGAGEVSQRLFEMRQALGYHALHEGRTHEARNYFWRAARGRYLCCRATLLWLALYLPQGWINRLRAARLSLSAEA